MENLSDVIIVAIITAASGLGGAWLGARASLKGTQKQLEHQNELNEKERKINYKERLKQAYLNLYKLICDLNRLHADIDEMLSTKKPDSGDIAFALEEIYMQSENEEIRRQAEKVAIFREGIFVKCAKGVDRYALIDEYIEEIKKLKSVVNQHLWPAATEIK